MFDKGNWIHKPNNFSISKNEVSITTSSNTDLWQKTHYGFERTNPHALIIECAQDFSFTVCVQYEYHGQYDQCGVLVYIDDDNWCKASIEYETKVFSRLGSVVTNYGYSDWATTDIENYAEMWYRISRRGADFLLENSYDGLTFVQMRIFHMHVLQKNLPQGNKESFIDHNVRKVFIGLYACSPLDSSFTARFNNIHVGPCLWDITH